MTATSEKLEQPIIGELVDGYDIAVINERAVRAGAGILFLGGAVSIGLAIAAGNTLPLQPFGFIFMMDMLIRVLVGDRFSPSLVLGRLVVSGQQPEWVGAPQKAFAWWLGFGLAFVSCTVMGFVNAPLLVTLILCSLCLSLLFVETAFGICVGCKLQSLFSKNEPQYCPGGNCTVEHSSQKETQK